jgi:hypothetical protein
MVALPGCFDGSEPEEEVLGATDLVLTRSTAQRPRAILDVVAPTITNNWHVVSILLVKTI